MSSIVLLCILKRVRHCYVLWLFTFASLANVSISIPVLMSDSNNKLFVSVDMDEWYLARWATGSQHAIWPDIETCCKEVYGRTDVKNLDAPTEIILQLFDELNFRSTFFFTGVMASVYPHLVKKIASLGHEIGCHNYHHIDYKEEIEQRFTEDLSRSKKMLEDMIGKEVIGYRSPNSSVPKDIVRHLQHAGFKYDSSVTPTRKLFGKFGDFIKAPSYPYHPDINNIGHEGNATLLEIPWAVFPYGKLPAGSGIMHRIAGDWYNSTAVRSVLQKGHTSYYFHPYEISSLDELKNRKLPLKAKIFLRDCGGNYFFKLKNFLSEHKRNLINGRDLYKLCIGA